MWLDIISKVKFWALLVAVVYYVLKVLNPDLPFTEDGLLTFILTLLALAGVHTEFMYRRLVNQLSVMGHVDQKKLWGG